MRWNFGSLSASTSAFTLKNVVSGLCLMPSQKVWMMSSFRDDVFFKARGYAVTIAS
jgi:hypothetical protein